MKKNKPYLLKNCILVITFGIFLITSCGPSEYPKISLDKLDPKLKSTGNKVAKDIITSMNHKDGVRFLKEKDYITPLVHGRIMRGMEMYNESFQMASVAIGNVEKISLFQVVDKGVIKTMRYKLKTDDKSLKFIELKIDVNVNYKLADFYLYLTSHDGFLKRENVFPKAAK
ncbi:hypothetical protein [Saccharicrinis fermentans]|uniref:Uncharacterized protein n=1 Tax=Saccharicrinis fermentans DSM 9555 = JCM 21142 TaxID=869213 RepID=W7YC41_9BACT|nr:hypothetical protein [Saccharicrinis fermentans]GAF06042.1 hypothetical protein JCM21142_134810 [Saccharicrinis fermentans DSM 9555 = JCM 21142]